MWETGLRHFDVSDSHRASGHRRSETDVHKHQLGKGRDPSNPEQDLAGVDTPHTHECFECTRKPGLAECALDLQSIPMGREELR